jgi:hypothetical protein
MNTLDLHILQLSNFDLGNPILNPDHSSSPQTIKNEGLGLIHNSCSAGYLQHLIILSHHNGSTELNGNAKTMRHIAGYLVKLIFDSDVAQYKRNKTTMQHSED